MRRGLSAVNLCALALGLAFLYLPILVVIALSVNESRLVSVWGGFSLRWYGAVWQNEALLAAVWVSLRVAAFSATIALVLGTLAGLALARAAQFRGRTMLAGLVYVPLVMPEVVTGLALLLLFVALEWERGALTITLAHATLSLGFVAVLVQSRMLSFDRALEEAALDLGATPFGAFFQVTLPAIWPAILSGWLLAFTLSLDDLVIASFTSGPGATTLPMRLYGQVRLGVSPEINVISTLLIGLAALALLVASLAQKLVRARTEAGAPMRD